MKKVNAVGFVGALELLGTTVTDLEISINMDVSTQFSTYWKILNFSGNVTTKCS